MSSDFKCGRIVWVKLGPRGDFKKRPAVIIETDDEDNPSEVILAAGSTVIGNPLGPNEVVLPYRKAGKHPITKLNRETVIVCDWIESVNPSQILAYGGEVPASTLSQILKKIP